MRGRFHRWIQISTGGRPAIDIFDDGEGGREGGSKADDAHADGRRRPRVPEHQPRGLHIGPLM